MDGTPPDLTLKSMVNSGPTYFPYCHERHLVLLLGFTLKG